MSAPDYIEFHTSYPKTRDRLKVADGFYVKAKRHDSQAMTEFVVFSAADEVCGVACATDEFVESTYGPEINETIHRSVMDVVRLTRRGTIIPKGNRRDG